MKKNQLRSQKTYGQPLADGHTKAIVTNMKKSVIRRFKEEIERALKDYPNMDSKYALKRIKEDYLKIPAKDREKFSIFDRVTMK